MSVLGVPKNDRIRDECGRGLPASGQAHRQSNRVFKRLCSRILEWWWRTWPGGGRSGGHHEYYTRTRVIYIDNNESVFIDTTWTTTRTTTRQRIAPHLVSCAQPRTAVQRIDAQVYQRHAHTNARVQTWRWRNANQIHFKRVWTKDTVRLAKP